MQNRYLKAFVTSAMSILPMILIVFLLTWTKFTTVSNTDQIVLAIGAVTMIGGLSLFQIGASKGLTKVGEYMGASLSKQKKLAIVIIFAFMLGALITCAEPSILIVSTQIAISKYLLIGSIALGVGIFVAIGVLRIIFNRSLKVWYLVFYFFVFTLLCFLQIDPNNARFLPFIFDAGGITTGSATVPFILALGAGVAAVRGGKQSTEDSFGLVGLASVGPILSMTLLIIANKQGFLDYTITEIGENINIFNRFTNALLYTSPTSMGSLVDVALALAPIIIIFFIYELIFIKLPWRKIASLFNGFVFSYIGLVLFLTGVSASMAPVGLTIGQQLGAKPESLVILLAFIIGLVTILCEPAVHVLTSQIQDVSSGHISKKTVLITLSLGVGVAICLAAIRSLFKFSIMFYLVPGYTIALLMMFICPDIFTAIAFDSGGTASGPMSVSFVLPLIIGITSYKNGITNEAYNLLSEAEKIKYSTDVRDGLHVLVQGQQFYEQSFGVVALIALTPILAIQILGIVVNIKRYQRLKAMRVQIHDENNSKIINF